MRLSKELSSIFMLKHIVLLIFTLNISLAQAAGILTGKVVGVSDGDTITVLDETNTQHKIRLAGIDAPEKKQPFGNISKKSLSDLVFDKQVRVDWQKQDQYGRTVGKVLVNNQDANLIQIKRGMAWFYKKFQNELVLEDRLAYLRAQEEAESNKAGLWQDVEPVAPWDFRKSRRN